MLTTTTRLAYEHKHQETDSVSAYLMPESWDDQNFILANGAIARVYEVGTLASMHLSDQDLDQICASIGSALGRVKDGVDLSLCLIPSKILDDDLRAYERAGGESIPPVMQANQEARIRLLQDSTRNPLFILPNGVPFRTKVWRVLLSIVAAPTEPLGSATDGLVDAAQDIWYQMKSVFTGEVLAQTKDETPAMRKFADLRASLTELVRESGDSITASLLSTGTIIAPLSPERLKLSYREILWPATGLDYPQTLDLSRQMAEQIPIGGMRVNSETGSIYTDFSEHVCYKTLTLQEFGKNDIMPGKLSIPNELLQGLSLISSLTDGFLTINARALTHAESGTYINKKLKGARSAIVPLDKVNLIESEALYLSGLRGQGHRFFWTSITACIYGRGATDTAAEEEAEARARIFLGQANLIDLKFRIEDIAAPTFFWQALPLGAKPPELASERYHFMPQEALAALVPVYRYDRGYRGDALLLGHNRDGEPFRVALAAVPPHFVVTGMSGQGKSVTVALVAANFARQDNSLVVYLDKDKSCLRTTKSFGDLGATYDLSSGGACLNLFGGTRQTSARTLQTLLPHLCSRTGASDDDSLAVLQEAAQKTFEKKLAKEVPYWSYDELMAKKPGTYVDRAAKRFRVRTPSAAVLDRAYDLLRSENNNVEASLYTIATITHQRVIIDGGRSVDRPYTNAKDLPQDQFQWLASRKILLRDPEGTSTDTQGIEVLLPDPRFIDDLQRNGYRLTVNPTEMEAHCAWDVDVLALVNLGVDFIIPEDLVPTLRERISQEIRSRAEYAGASDATLEPLIARRMSALKGTDLEPLVQGTADIQHEVFITDFAETLKAMGNDGNELAHKLLGRLANYYGAGTYAQYFDGPTNIQLDGKRMVCIETGNLKETDAHLFQALVIGVWQMVALYSRAPRNRRRPKAFIIDESWQLFDMPAIDPYIDNESRTARKFNLTLGFISQRITDFTDKTAGLTVLTQAPTRFYLYQEKEVFVKAQKDLQLTPRQVQALTHVRTEHGYFAEILVDQRIGASQHIFDVLRLALTSPEYWTTTTDGVDVQYYEEVTEDLQARNPTLPNDEILGMAISASARRYPRGLKAAKAAANLH